LDNLPSQRIYIGIVVNYDGNVVNGSVLPHSQFTEMREDDE
jgi:hypothetical protein